MRSCKYLLAENHCFCLDKLHILLVVLGFFSINMGFYYILIQILQYYKDAQTSTVNAMFILLCELFVTLTHDEMNCDFVNGVFL
jgi:hypothetical protein